MKKTQSAFVLTLTALSLCFSPATIVLVLAASGVCFAQVLTTQVAVPGIPEEGPNFVYATPTVVAGVASFDGKTVKGQPYTADAVTETNQVLSDGNRISRKETASVARDSEGRTRREQTLNAVGPWATSSDDSQKKIVFINDPVAQVNYVLEPNHIARKMPSLGSGEIMRVEAGAVTALRTEDGASTFHIQKLSSAEPKESKLTPKIEQLGTQEIEGVQAEGTRTTITIPAGQIGNEKPINMVSERWYSSELQTTVMTKSSDPRTGETVFHLTNIQRSEPPASLFEVPSDYKIEEGKIKFATTRMIQPKE